MILVIIVFGAWHARQENTQKLPGGHRFIFQPQKRPDAGI